MAKTRLCERGEMALQVALMMPVIVVLVATVFDVGHCVQQANDLNAAADYAARALEANSVGTPSVQTVRDALSTAYSDSANRVEVSLTSRGRDTQAVGYKIYSPSSGNFKMRNSKVATDRYVVELRYTGRWISPLFAGTASFLGAGDTYTLVAQSPVGIDATLEEW